MSSTFTLLVNGKTERVAVDYIDEPLLHVLREALKLKGTRFGCGNGQCGACTVLVDGRAQHACELPVWSMEGRSITTIEGLGTLERPHPLQQALIDFQAGQCGYCLSGIVMKAAELVATAGEPDRGKIRAALAANLCRCGAHARILNAIEAAWRKLANEARS
jgi:nicotinate dehydrogenase subunit A